MNTLIVSRSLLDPVTIQLRGMLRARADCQNPVTVSFDNLAQSSIQGRVDLAIVSLTADAERGLEVLRNVRQWMRGYLLAVGHVSDPKLILRALQSGADYYLDEEALESEFDVGLSRLKIKKERDTPASSGRLLTGRLLAVLSASGGTGASTLAVNIAAVLARAKEKCALIDLKPGRGDLASLLDLKPPFTLADLCLNADRLDRTMFEKMLVRHPSGVYLLGSPQMFGDIQRVTPAGVGEGLQLARAYFPCTVVDLEDCFHHEQVVALRHATEILLVTRLDFTSLRNARRILEHVQELELAEAGIEVVVSRYGQPNELPMEEAENALGQKLTHFIPEDSKTVNAANNTGVPVVLRSPNAKVSLAIARVARACLQGNGAKSAGVVTQHDGGQRGDDQWCAT
jgi:pilus assembly protein CpaE